MSVVRVLVQPLSRPCPSQAALDKAQQDSAEKVEAVHAFESRIAELTGELQAARATLATMEEGAYGFLNFFSSYRSLSTL